MVALAELRQLSERVSAISDGRDKYNAVAIDFDGVLAAYDGWRGHEHMGAPVAGSQDFLKELKARHYKVIVHTTRGSNEVRAWLDKWCMGQYVDEVNANSELQGNNPGKPVANFYIDDRAIQFRGNWSDVLQQMDEFHPWWHNAQI